jgi:hypothetical protein
MDFLPQGYAGVPKTNSKYLKFIEGNNKFRILSSAITGFIDWTEDKKPLRTREYPKQLVNAAKPAKHFWAFVVFDYLSSEVKILEITQATVQTAIFDLHADPNWGNPQNFDLTVKKTGKDMETKYSVIPTPPMPLKPEIKQLYEGLNINLNALYEGLDPFTQSSTENASTGQIEPSQEVLDDDIKAIDSIQF